MSIVLHTEDVPWNTGYFEGSRNNIGTAGDPPFVGVQPLMNQMVLEEVTHHWQHPCDALHEQLSEMVLDEMLTHEDETVRKFGLLIIEKSRLHDQ